MNGDDPDWQAWYDAHAARLLRQRAHARIAAEPRLKPEPAAAEARSPTT
jgi:hypothetical protein